MTTDFLKTHGFERPPVAILEGHTIGYGKSGAGAYYKCLACGAQITVKLRGNSNTMTQDNLDKWGKMKAESHHQCAVIAGMVDHDKKKIFADIYRGADKKNDLDYKAEKKGHA